MAFNRIGHVNNILGHAERRLRTASDIPALLQRARVAPGSRTYKDGPWFSLWSALCHQGDVYSASYAAVPELIDIAKSRILEPAVVRDCLLLASFIEVERVSPEEGHTPPPLTSDIAAAYQASLSIGADLAATMLIGDPDSERKRSHAIAYAALGGDVTEARRLEQMEE